MDAEAYHGTLTSKLKPIVTMLTDALARDFCPLYEYQPEVSKVAGRDMWERGGKMVDEQQLWHDVHDWLMGLEHELEDENDRQFARMCARMIRKNKGWVTLLTNRVKKRIT